MPEQIPFDNTPEINVYWNLKQSADHINLLWYKGASIKYVHIYKVGGQKLVNLSYVHNA